MFRTLFALFATLLLGTAQAQAPEPRFDVLEFRVEGNTVLANERVESAVYRFLGTGRTAADMEQARAALEAAYREIGFGTVTVDIPEQRITDGTVVLAVTEGKVARVRVTGAKYFSQERILREVPALAEGTVPNFPQISAQLAGVNRSADRRVTPLLRPGKQPGTTEVDLAVEDRLPLSGSLELNNRHGANTTATRLQGALRYDNLWQRDHGLGLQFQLSPENRREVSVFSASYTIPDGGNVWALSWLESDNNTISGVGSTTVAGKGRVLGLRWIGVVPEGERGYQTYTLGGDWKDFRETVLTAGSGSEGFSTPVTYLPFTLAFTRSVGDAQGRWSGGAGLTFAIAGLPGKDREFADKRYLGRAGFGVLKFDLAREQSLPWAGLQLAARLEGQTTGQPLISNEQFAAGGVDSVRGYLEGAAVGDRALRASLELRSPDLMPRPWAEAGALRVHGFADGAGLWLVSPLPGQQKQFGLVSVGTGLRLAGTRYGSLALDLAWPLRALGSTQAREPRLHASGTFTF